MRNAGNNQSHNKVILGLKIYNVLSQLSSFIIDAITLVQIKELMVMHTMRKCRSDRTRYVLIKRHLGKFYLTYIFVIDTPEQR